MHSPTSQSKRSVGVDVSKRYRIYRDADGLGTHPPSHEVLGLARSDAAIAALKRQRVEFYWGSLGSFDAMSAANHDEGVAHLAFTQTSRRTHPPSEATALEMLASAPQGSG